MIGCEKVQVALCYLPKHNRRRTPIQTTVARAHCLLEARHSADSMTVAIVCQSWDGYFLMYWQGSSSLWYHWPVSTVLGLALTGQMWHLADCFPAGPSFGSWRRRQWHGSLSQLEKCTVCAVSLVTFPHLCHNICHLHLSPAHFDEFSLSLASHNTSAPSWR